MVGSWAHKWFFSPTDTLGYLGYGNMHVLSTNQTRILLNKAYEHLNKKIPEPHIIEIKPSNTYYRVTQAPFVIISDNYESTYDNLSNSYR